MTLRWVVERVETDYFAYNKDPILQYIDNSGNWHTVPTKVIKIDKTTRTIELPEEVPGEVSDMSAYPHTTDHLDKCVC
jgi:hypothetical protein